VVFIVWTDRAARPVVDSRFANDAPQGATGPTMKPKLPTGAPQPSQPAPSAAPRGDIARLKQAASATSEEFTEFLARMRGKSPKEVLGAIARSGLTMGIVLSLLLNAVVLAGFTVGPYLYEKKFGKPETAKKKDKDEASEPTPQPKVADTKTPKDKADPKDTKADIAKKLGITETKPADPKVNPLDKGDDLEKFLNK